MADLDFTILKRLRHLAEETCFDRESLLPRCLGTLIPASDTDLIRDVSKEIEVIDFHVLPFRQHRNRRIGHCDCATEKKHANALLPSLGLTDTDSVLAEIESFLNRVELFYDQNEQQYCEGIYGPGNASDFLDFIIYEKQLRKSRSRRF